MSRKKCIETIYEAVEKNDPEECWMWPHALNRYGYGAVWIDCEAASIRLR